MLLALFQLHLVQVVSKREIELTAGTSLDSEGGDVVGSSGAGGTTLGVVSVRSDSSISSGDLRAVTGTAR